MNQALIFAMGQYAARFPTDRQYARNHMWAQSGTAGVVRFGFTAYAVRLMLDVYFLEWHVEPGIDLSPAQEIGAIESKKAESSLYAPMPGRLRQFNPKTLADPSIINLDNYGEGWLLEIEGAAAGLMSPEDYLKYLGTVWEKAQKAIRGQLNKE